MLEHIPVYNGDQRLCGEFTSASQSQQTTIKTCIQTYSQLGSPNIHFGWWEKTGAPG